MVEVLKAIQAVIDYMYDDEQEDWESCGKPENHIFTHLKILDQFLNSVFQWVDEK